MKLNSNANVTVFERKFLSDTKNKVNNDIRDSQNILLKGGLLKLVIW
jgi:hypothetical protein